ncbi:hypothetical protein GQ53DRAFT_877142 [Thozetella sp. PMI_491]|nr:hypothetical protein GQ53DRAFT_877142 [Thozetella sp. PMI_491]
MPFDEQQDVPSIPVLASTPAPATKTYSRRRESRVKVRIGCNNCKLRRIKCDEKRPTCTNCSRSKKICSGYPASRITRTGEIIYPKRITATDMKAISGTRARFQPQQSAWNLPSPLYSPSTLSFNEQQGRYFQLFCEHITGDLSGFFNNAFWSRIVLQECHSEAAVRHAVVALGALYYILEKREEPRSSSSADIQGYNYDITRHWEIAVRQYSQAINALMEVGRADTQSHRTCLVASALLAYFDSFIGDHKQAIIQIRNGLRLLEQPRAEWQRAFLPRPEEAVEEELVQMFTGLAIQAKTYDMAFHFSQPWVIELTASHSSDSSSWEGASPISIQSQTLFPEEFESTLEARLALYSLLERIFRFNEVMFKAIPDCSAGILPPSMRQYGLRFKDEIEAWSDAYDHILTCRRIPGVTDQERSAIAVLKMGQITAQVVFLMTFADSEGTFDLFMPQFRAINSLAYEVVGDDEKKPSFSTELGIVPPLYFVATKCRDPLIRREAIQLLTKSSRREAMWDSELAARIATWVMELEEDGLSPLEQDDKPSQTVPNEKRVRVRAVEFDLRERFAVVQVGSRGLPSGVPDAKSRGTRITW